MSEEILDVVNERDEVIGQQTRPEVHRLGLKHRAVHVLVFNRRGELFLQKRSMSKDRHPGTWDSSASGHLDQGEDYDACAVRELREEIGLAVLEPPVRLFKLGACKETGQEFVWVYRCRAEGPFALNSEEISEGGWFAPEEVTRWIEEKPGDFAPTFPVIWKRLATNRASSGQGSDREGTSAENGRAGLSSPALPQHENCQNSNLFPVPRQSPVRGTKQGTRKRGWLPGLGDQR